MTELKRSPRASPRPRNAVATRDAILQSALAAFSRAGYDGVGVREIAREAGVTAMLINRYFGSKEELFAAVVDVAFADTSLFTGDTASLARDVAIAIVGKPAAGAEPIDPLLMMMRSAANPRAAEILRDSIAQQFERPLAAQLPGSHVRERAALFLSLIAGFQLMRRVIGSKALVEANAARLSAQLAAMFQLIVDRG